METRDINEVKEEGQCGRRPFQGHNARRSRLFTGLFFIAVGGLFLLREAGLPFPNWFFSWPMLLIGIGLFSGLKHGFRNPGWLFPLAIGAIFLADRISADFNLRPYLWPIVLIAVGLFIMVRPRRHRPFTGDDDNNNESSSTNSFSPDPEGSSKANREDQLDVVAVFGGVKRHVLSKNFRGGDIVAIMGGTEINLSQADFQDRIKIDCVNVFGGTKLIIPPDWEVQSDVAAVFGGVDDKRPPVSNTSGPAKIIYLEGTCIFGGLEIKSF